MAPPPLAPYTCRVHGGRLFPLTSEEPHCHQEFRSDGASQWAPQQSHRAVSGQGSDALAARVYIYYVLVYTGEKTPSRVLLLSLLLGRFSGRHVLLGNHFITEPWPQKVWHALRTAGSVCHPGACICSRLKMPFCTQGNLNLHAG
ncbi:hypothetical protein MRX96_005998 [Rhipicephalus microplus]